MLILNKTECVISKGLLTTIEEVVINLWLRQSRTPQRGLKSRNINVRSYALKMDAASTASHARLLSWELRLSHALRLLKQHLAASKNKRGMWYSSWFLISIKLPRLKYMSHRLPVAVSIPVVLKVSEFIKPH
jgi:hypothetical protein